MKVLIFIFDPSLKTTTLVYQVIARYYQVKTMFYQAITSNNYDISSYDKVLPIYNKLALKSISANLRSSTDIFGNYNYISLLQ